MRVAMLSSISWRTPPRAYGPWELVTSLLTEALVERVGEIDRAACRRAVAERFTVDRMADRYLELYRSLISR